MRLFNDLNAQSVDWWSAASTFVEERTVNSAGRYILTSIPKSEAANMYMYIMRDGQRVYLYKGNNVT